MTQLLPFMMFAFVASITPGPSNILVLGNSARYGFVAALPVVWGSCAGAAGLVLLLGLGIGSWLESQPIVQTALSWVGAIWLTYMAWLIASKPTEIDVSAPGKPTNALTAATLQVINPKTWAMAIAVVSIFAGKDAEPSRYVLLGGIFLFTALPCLGIWAAFGSGARKLFKSPGSSRTINIVLGLALFASAWIGVAERAITVP